MRARERPPSAVLPTARQNASTDSLHEHQISTARGASRHHLPTRDVERDAGETVLEAFRRFALTPRGLLALDDAPSGEAARSRAAVRVILESPALQARERQILEGYSASLAERLAEESGAAVDDVEPQVVADALIAVHRALLDYVRRRIVAGEPPEALRRDFRAQGRHAFARLGRGFGDYAPK